MEPEVGILCGVDRKPPRANLRSDRDLPGTWVGITTEGDLIALTDYLEDPSYYKNRPPAPPKASRGQLCGDFLVTMAEAGPDKHFDDAEKWIQQYSQGWNTNMEGLNLLVVQDAGEQQYVGANREGSELLALHHETEHHSLSSDQSIMARVASMCNQLVCFPTSSNSHPKHYRPPRIPRGTVTGLSNSVFARPWKRVEIGAKAFEDVLDRSLERFGSGYRAPRLQLSPIEPVQATPIPDLSIEKVSNTMQDDTVEFAWLVMELLTALRVHTKPYPKNLESFDAFTSGLADRVFIPRTDLQPFAVPHVQGEYGTRSSTVVLFGRNGRAVYVEKNWYAPRCPTTGERRLFDADSAEGVVWWQGRIGQPRSEWTHLQEHELEVLFKNAREPVQSL